MRDDSMAAKTHTNTQSPLTRWKAQPQWDTATASLCANNQLIHKPAMIVRKRIESKVKPRRAQHLCGIHRIIHIHKLSSRVWRKKTHCMMNRSTTLCGWNHWWGAWCTRMLFCLSQTRVRATKAKNMVAVVWAQCTTALNVNAMIIQLKSLPVP